MQWHCSSVFAIALAKQEAGRTLKVSSECKFCVLRVRAYIQNTYLPNKLQWISELLQAPDEKAYSAA